MTNHHPYAPGKIPPGITFGKKVVLIPYTSHVFNRPLWEQALIGNPQKLHDSYSWVSRGDHFAKFTILTPKHGITLVDLFYPKTHNEIFLKCPVSGLLLNSSHYYGNDTDSYNPTSLLIPDDEPPAEDGDYIFSDLCNFCWNHREYIFYKSAGFSRKVSRDQSLREARDQSLREAFAEQRNRSCLYVDAMPRYEDYFRDARTKHTQLRPFLKHLL